MQECNSPPVGEMPLTEVCGACLNLLPRLGQYRNSRACRLCRNHYMRLWSKANRASCSASVRNWKSKNRRRLSTYMKREKLNHRKQYLARKAVYDAVRRNHLTRPFSCEGCRTACVPHGHHSDYSKRLKVVWLCKDCHAAEHGGT